MIATYCGSLIKQDGASCPENTIENLFCKLLSHLWNRPKRKEAIGAFKLQVRVTVGTPDSGSIQRWRVVLGDWVSVGGFDWGGALVVELNLFAFGQHTMKKDRVIC